MLKFRHSISRKGHRTDELASLLQKAIRVGETALAEAAFAELATLIDYANSEDPEELKKQKRVGRGLRTMAINRLMVIAMEDIGMANPKLVQQVVENLMPLTAKTERQRLPLNWSKAIGCIRALCESNKTRVQSWLYHAYGVQANVEQARQAGLAVRPFEPTMALRDPNCFQCVDEKETRDQLWRRLVAEPTSERASICRTLWRVSKQLGEQSQRPCLALALCLHYFQWVGQDNAYSIVPCPIAEVVSLQEGQYGCEIRMQTVQGVCVLDTHTSVGRQAGKQSADFRREGTLVQPEDGRYKDPVLERLYRHSKRDL